MSLTINHQTNDISASSGTATVDGAAAGAVTTLGAVGAPALAYRSSSSSATPGTTLAGSGLYYANTFVYGNSYYGGSSTSLGSGTWRVMGNYGYYNGGATTSTYECRITLAVRIS